MQVVYQKVFSVLFFLTVIFSFISVSLVHGAESTGPPENKYVGVEACVECHEDIVATYRKNSRKAHSHDSLKKMQEKLTDAEFRSCLSCHTTGYGQPGGFTSFERTPQLAMVGCESCHGMGYLHTIEQTTESLVQKPTLETCQKCHDDSRVNRINYDGRIHAGGH